jgi:hypothetical protein
MMEAICLSQKPPVLIFAAVRAFSTKDMANVQNSDLKSGKYNTVGVRVIKRITNIN